MPQETPSSPDIAPAAAAPAAVTPTPTPSPEPAASAAPAQPSAAGEPPPESPSEREPQLHPHPQPRGDKRAAPVDTAACAAELKARFPALFGGASRPLKLQIQADIQARAPGVFTRRELSAFLHRYTTSTNYLIALSQQPARLDLDGQPAGEVAAEHRDAAAHEVERRRALRKEREAQMQEARRAARQGHRADEGRPPRRTEPGAAAPAAAAAPARPAAEDPARRDRARLLRDFESSPLAKANFCALKGIAPEALDAQLALARQEAAERFAARGPAPQQGEGGAPVHGERRREPRHEARQAQRPQERPPNRPNDRPQDRRADPRPERRHEGAAPRHEPPREPRRADARGHAAAVPPGEQGHERRNEPGRERGRDRGARSAAAREQAPDIVVRADALHRLALAIVERGGSLPEEAEHVARHLVDANLAGHDSHGVGMLPRYVDNLLAGVLVPNQQLVVRADHGALLTLDGQAGYGQAIGVQAMQLGMARARTHGVAVLGLSHSHHLGRIGAYAELCAAQGFASIHFVNVISPPHVAPFGGSDARFATNPMCIAVPMADAEAPLVLDFATSRIAFGKARVAHHRGQPVAAGALIDEAGRPTRDPGTLFREPRGAMLPFGGHKGYGLAVACEILAGALAGGGTLHAPPGSGAIINNMLSFIVDPERLGTAAHLAQEARAFAEWVKASPPSRDAAVLLPGDPERASRARRSEEGIPIDANTWAELIAAGVGLGLEEATLRELAQLG